MNRKKIVVIVGIIVAIVIAAVVIMAVFRGYDTPKPTDPTNTPTVPTTQGADPTQDTEPTVPPTAPTDPDLPTDPTDPEGPTDPTDPAGPTDPTVPTDPTEPEKPTEPTEPVHSHDYKAEKVVTPTCEKEGYTLYVCECGDSYKGANTAALGHNYSKEVVDPTCDKGGYSHYTCSRCGHEYDGDKTEARGHKMGDWEVTKEATCETEGSKQRICDRCNHKETQAISVKEHEFMDGTSVEATCTMPGYFEAECKSCHKIIRQEIPAKGHCWETVSLMEPTCSKPGYRDSKCTVCAHTNHEEIPTSGHTWGAWTLVRDATCTENGRADRQCRDCDKIQQKDIPAEGHFWGLWTTTKEYTDTEDGIRQRACRRSGCDAIESEIIDHTHPRHDWATRVVEGEGCTQSDWKEWYCTKCGYIGKIEGIPGTAPGHDWADWETTKEPGPGVAGEEKRHCKNCGKEEILPIEPLDENGEKLESYIDPKIEQVQGIADIYYKYGKFNISDIRKTWGSYLYMKVNADDSITVRFYDKEGELVEIVMVVMEAYDLTCLTIYEDGNYYYYGFNGFH